MTSFDEILSFHDCYVKFKIAALDLMSIPSRGAKSLFAVILGYFGSFEGGGG